MTRVILSDRSMTAPLPDTPIIANPVVADNFNRPDGPLGTTPLGDQQWNQRTATIQVVNNRAEAISTAGSTGALWEVDTGLATGMFYLTALSPRTQLYVRGTDDSSGYLFGRADETSYRLSIRNSGSNTSLDVVSGPTMTGPEQLAVKVSANGLMVCQVNGATIMEYQDTTHNGTLAGIRLIRVGDQADDFAAYA